MGEVCTIINIYALDGSLVLFFSFILVLVACTLYYYFILDANVRPGSVHDVVFIFKVI